MFRYAKTVFGALRPLTKHYYNVASTISNNTRTFSLWNVNTNKSSIVPLQQSMLQNKQILDISTKIVPIQARTVTKFSLNKGKRKTVGAVVRRFFRLHWGGWIRTKVGKNKKMWKKSSSNRRRLRQHVFCNATQNTLLDKMVTKYWKKPRYYVDDPYAPYHTREEFPYTKKNPI